MNIIVTGAASGLGRKIALALLELTNANVIQLDIKDETQGEWADKTHPAFSSASSCCVGGFNVAQESHWSGLAFNLEGWGYDHIDGIINCAGVNCNEWFEEVSQNSFFSVMQTNAFSFVLSGQALMDKLRGADNPFILNIVSNAAHMPMTSSLAYNASKAAGLMITRQMAHELTPKYGITVFSISPNKLEGTEMSKQIEDNVMKVRGWTAEFAKEYQRKALMHGRETSPTVLAEFIANIVLTGQYKFMSGTDIPFGK